MISRNGIIAPRREDAGASCLYSAMAPETSTYQPLFQAGQLVDLALTNNLDALWIMAHTLESRVGFAAETTRMFAAETSQTASRIHYDDDGRITCMHAWKKRPGGETNRQRDTLNDPHRTIRIFFLEHDERWGLEGITNPYQLLNTIDLVEESMGHYCDWSPGATGKALIVQLNNGHRAPWIAPPDFTGTPWLPTAEEMAHGHAVPLSTNGTKKHLPVDTGVHYNLAEPFYLHIYDKRYAYGGACTSTSLGEGDPEFWPDARGKWNKRLPGIWRVGNAWKYTPEVEHMLAEGWVSREQLGGAYVWPTYHQTLRPFAEQMWQVELATHANPLARQLGKAIRTQGLGWLAMDVRQFRENPELEAVGGFYRPDFWGMIVSEARVKMNYKINQLYARGYEAVWWNFDELGFFSNEPNPTLAVPIFERPDALGGFRHRYSLLMDAEILCAFSNSVSFADCHKLLLAKRKQQQTQWSFDGSLLMPAGRDSCG